MKTKTKTSSEITNYGVNLKKPRVIPSEELKASKARPIVLQT